MNYGKYEAERRLKSLHSKSGKYASRLLLNIFKALFFLFLFLAVVGASIGFGMVKGIIDNAPSVDILNIQPSRFATAVYDSAGNLTDTLVTSGSNREEATYEELPKDLINAFVSIEDSRFWSHNGIDIRSIARAVKGIVSDDYAGGGSTITQQLIKNNVFSGGMESGWGARIERKLQEQYLAVQLEKNSGMSKEDTKKLIITNYLNTINLGNNTLGVKVAAKRYFNKDVSDLTLSECTVLASITKNPSRLNPISGRENNAERRRIVLQYMYEQGYITKAQQEEALADDVYDRIQNVDTAAKGTNSHYSYFTDELIEQVITALMEKLDEFYTSGKYIAAICAAPSIFGHRGYLKGRKATSYPDFESHLEGADVTGAAAIVDGNVITGRGMGCAIPFGLAIVEHFKGKSAADELAEKIVYSR